MAIGANRAHAGAVLEVNGLGIFLVNRVFHLVTGDAEVQRVRVFHEGIEAAPEYDTANTARDE